MCDDTDVCGCGDPTCPRGPAPWLPCHNPDRLIDRMLALDSARARRLGRTNQAAARQAMIFRASELARRG